MFYFLLCDSHIIIIFNILHLYDHIINNIIAQTSILLLQCTSLYYRNRRLITNKQQAFYRPKITPSLHRWSMQLISYLKYYLL